jgi:TatD DNase family protein
MLIDIGANLTHPSFAHDASAVVARAIAAGVGQIILTGTTVAISQQALALARALAPTHPACLFTTAGIHPHHAVDYDDAADAALRALLQEPEVRAVGETGLDYNRDFSPRPRQRQAFEAQLAIAVDVGKPLFLHERDAHDDFVGILDSISARTAPAVVHCFSGTKAELFAYLDRDCFIGITGWVCDERRGQGLRELVRHIPANRLLVETDAPFLLPHTVRPRPADPRRNEPMYLPQVVETLARERGEPVAVTAGNSTAAARVFFGLAG